MKRLIIAAASVVILISLLVWTKVDSVIKIPLPDAGTVVGQNIVVGVPTTVLDDLTKNFLKKVKPAGIILYRQNISSHDQLRQFISDLQEFAKETTGQPYLAMLDEEPEGATRLGLFANVINEEIDWEQIGSDIDSMKDIGVNVDLAPVYDYPFVKNSFIQSRLPFSTADQLEKFNIQFVKALEGKGMGATLKHYPGLGLFLSDPHKNFTYSYAKSDEIDASMDLFKQGIKAGASFVMTNHGIYNEIEPGVPATFSEKIIEGLRKIGFDGIIISDDISDMPLLGERVKTVPDAAVETLKAGHTLVLFSRKIPLTERSYEHLLNMYSKDSKLKNIMDSNYRMVVAYKNARLKNGN